MRYIFSESRPDYGAHLSPYQVWAVLDAGERPDDAFAQGLLPGAYDLSRFYLARSLRVVLDRFTSTSDMRNVARRNATVTHRAVPAAEFDFDAGWQALAGEYLTRRLDGAFSFEKFTKFMGSALATHVLAFSDESGRPVGLLPVYVGVEGAYCGMPVYDLARLQQRMGRHIIATSVAYFQSLGLTYGYLGTCYSTGALYKTRFPGLQFFNGHRWSEDRAELHFLIEHQDALARTHQLEYQPYLQEFVPDGVAALLASSAPAGPSSPPRGIANRAGTP